MSRGSTSERRRGGEEWGGVNVAETVQTEHRPQLWRSGRDGLPSPAHLEEVLRRQLARSTVGSGRQLGETADKGMAQDLWGEILGWVALRFK